MACLKAKSNVNDLKSAYVKSVCQFQSIRPRKRPLLSPTWRLYSTISHRDSDILESFERPNHLHYSSPQMIPSHRARAHRTLRARVRTIAARRAKDEAWSRQQQNIASFIPSRDQSPDDDKDNIPGRCDKGSYSILMFRGRYSTQRINLYSNTRF